MAPTLNRASIPLRAIKPSAESAIWGSACSPVFPQIAESYRGRVGMQFGVLVEVLFDGARGHAVWGICGAVLQQVPCNCPKQVP